MQKTITLIGLSLSLLMIAGAANAQTQPIADSVVASTRELVGEGYGKSSNRAGQHRQRLRGLSSEALGLMGSRSEIDAMRRELTRLSEADAKRATNEVDASSARE